jgi:hypothetical protein
MKKKMLLGVVAALVTLALGTGANAQAAVQNRIAKVKCPGNTAACIKLDLYQAMASTNAGAGKAASSQGAARGAAPASLKSAMHKSSVGGVENNPMNESTSGLARAHGVERSFHRPQAGAAEGRAPAALRSREVTRHRPQD